MAFVGSVYTSYVPLGTSAWTPRSVSSPGFSNTQLLEDFETRMLRPAHAVEELDTLLGPAGCYHDPRLQSDVKVYAKFVRRCNSIGLVAFTTECLAELGIFFVRKKDGALRLILDCRRTNRLFLDPPSTQLVTGEGLGRVEIDWDDGAAFDGWEMRFQIALGVGDVSNCFHGMRLRGKI